MLMPTDSTAASHTPPAQRFLGKPPECTFSSMTSCRRSPWALVTVCLFGLYATGAARAQDVPPTPTPEAKRAFADGRAAYDRGDYPLALEQFRRASAIAPAPSLDYNIGMALERLQLFEDSAQSFDSYLQRVPPPQTDEERTFQANLRARAAANHERALHPTPVGDDTPPAPLIESPPSRTPTFYPPTRSPAFVAPTPLPSYAPSVGLDREQRITLALRRRSSGIGLTVAGAVLIGVGSGVIGWAATTLDGGATDVVYSATRIGIVVAGSICLLVGVPMAIPGIVMWATGQRQLDRLRSGGAARRAAIDLAAPAMLLSKGDNAMVFAAPAVRF